MKASEGLDASGRATLLERLVGESGEKDKSR
ncbi:hypothetical protein DES53_104475 [Roseimicrobium gellanilyticum]|uniref:Uncharacterized protein n=1 Tax=Roseimicrobium gellanilyticum TaxID=748857 RepID=A0A366HNP4_9BACT|nr:hypothetical protein DES53_104475 [Roseimicrobium gellanilyticum]